MKTNFHNVSCNYVEGQINKPSELCFVWFPFHRKVIILIHGACKFYTSFKAFNGGRKIKVCVCVLRFDGVFNVNQMVKRVGISIKMQSEKLELREKSSRRRFGYQDKCISN